jgi:peroxiredoxin Q/BCP
MKHLALGLVLAAAALVLPQDHDETANGGPPEVGDAAPVFRLNDHEGQVATVGGANPKWTIVAFYPKALTPG